MYLNICTYSHQIRALDLIVRLPAYDLLFMYSIDGLQSFAPVFPFGLFFSSCINVDILP